MARMSTGLVSYADLQQMPDDGRQYELYDGEVRVVPSPTNRHQFVLLNLVAVLMEYRQQHGGRLLFAPSDVVFTQYDVVQPDLLYFSEARRHLVQLDAPTSAAPDLTVEVISPGTSTHDRVRKQATYARFGVREYWIVDPFEETIESFSLDGHVYRAASITGSTGVAVSPGIPGLRVAAARIFDLS
jgi:Uma2 family endonuclease